MGRRPDPSKMRPGTLPTALALVLAAGCAGADGPPAGAGAAQVDTLENGRVRVVNAGPSWSEAEAWTAEEDLRLGTLDGEGHDQFGQIAAVKADAEGRIYVLDFQTQDIRVFETDGTWSHTIGRPGQGPGELMRAAGLNWGPDGNLWVWDPGGRFSVFRPSGEFVESHPRQVRGVVFPWRGDFDDDGSLVDWGLEYPGLVPGISSEPRRIIYYPVRFSGDFQTGDTLPTLSFDFETSSEGTRMQFGEILSSFQDRRDGIWFAHNKTFTIYRRTLEGDTTLQFSMDASPARVTQADIDSVRAIYIEQGRPEAAPSDDAFAPTKPMIRRIFADDAGHVFVLSELDGLPLGTFVDVFHESGRYLGRVDLPAPVNFPYPPPHATATHLYYVTTDDVGVEYVVRVRLRKPAGSGGPRPRVP